MINILFLIKKLFHNCFSMGANARLGLWWILICIFVFRRNSVVFRKTVSLAIPLVLIHVHYWRFWFKYYLKRDHGWHDARSKMIANLFCPFDVEECYGNLLAGDSKALETIKGLHLEKEFKERQERCQSLNLY